MTMKVTCSRCGAEWTIQKTDYDPSYLRCPHGCDAPDTPKRKLTRAEAAKLALQVYETGKREVKHG